MLVHRNRAGLPQMRFTVLKHKKARCVSSGPLRDCKGF